MDKTAEGSMGNTSIYYPFYQTLFEAVDTTSFFWQPILKAIGRSQLELAALQARQAEAMIQWTRDIMRPGSPMEILKANARLWTSFADHFAEAVPRVASAVSSATESVAPIIIPAPVKRARDKLILLERDADGTFERKVA
jgi:hypothetical protein